MPQRSVSLPWFCVMATVFAACAAEKRHSSGADTEADGGDEKVAVDARPAADVVVKPTPPPVAAADAGLTTAKDGPSPDAPGDKAAAGGADAAAPGTFANVTALFVARCVLCHTAVATDTVNLEPMGLYARIVNKKPPAMAAAACRAFTLVVPGDLAKSLLYQKILPVGMLGGCGVRMPNVCSDEPDPKKCRLSDAEITTIGDWIVAGAKM